MIILNKKLRIKNYRRLFVNSLFLIRNSNKGGFTLIEVLIYSVLVTMITAFAIISTYQLIEFSDKGIYLRALADNQKLVEQKLYWTLQSISSINTPSAGATSTTLSVTKLNYGGNPVVLDFSNGSLKLSRAGGAYQPINSDLVLVQNLSFHQFNFSGYPAIRVEGTLFSAFASATADIDLTIFTK